MKKEKRSAIFPDLGAYLKTTLALLKYESIERCSTLLAELILDLIVALFFVTAFTFLSIALVAFAIHFLHSRWQGFAIVFILYFLLALLSYRFKLPVENRLISYILRKFIKKSSGRTS